MSMFDRDTIIRLAREAGITAGVGTTDRNGKYTPLVNALGRSVPVEWLEKFAELVAEKERYACARICESMHEEDRPSDYSYAIRARSES